ncbi:hypothetical protein Dsin_022135 [Dipteronia sinensis]|uniref:Reverse transcriptase domain-containing protein n=1 Tax=Dipteronia sinensis TaxID=43782 RepID=A0AAE0A0Y7_9ROSI|nr:hypothetical protein Dsin_022135 [Dipteronia sinensis]
MGADPCYSRSAHLSPQVPTPNIYSLFFSYKFQQLSIDYLSLPLPSNSDSELLEAAFSYKEVWEVLRRCDGNKALGPDGMDFNFIKANWKTISSDIMSFFDEFHRDGSIEEIIHHWKKDKNGGLLVKLDFEKAYDSVDHGFLDFMMSEMGFGLKWRQWMGNCITSPSLSVLVNSYPTEQLRLEKDLPQGDPLSLFLFNIAIEGLHRLFERSFELDLMRGVVFGDNEVHIYHLQFANDRMLFSSTESGISSQCQEDSKMF